MSANLKSFDRSPLKSFVRSPLKARNNGPLECGNVAWKLIIAEGLWCGLKREVPGYFYPDGYPQNNADCRKFGHRKIVELYDGGGGDFTKLTHEQNMVFASCVQDLNDSSVDPPGRDPISLSQLLSENNQLVIDSLVDAGDTVTIAYHNLLDSANHGTWILTMSDEFTKDLMLSKLGNILNALEFDDLADPDGNVWPSPDMAGFPDGILGLHDLIITAGLVAGNDGVPKEILGHSWRPSTPQMSNIVDNQNGINSPIIPSRGQCGDAYETKSFDLALAYGIVLCSLHSQDGNSCDVCYAAKLQARGYAVDWVNPSSFTIARFEYDTGGDPALLNCFHTDPFCPVSSCSTETYTGIKTFAETAEKASKIRHNFPASGNCSCSFTPTRVINPD